MVKTRVEILCTEQIPRLLSGADPNEVFEEKIRVCDETCPEYYKRMRTISATCEQDMGDVESHLCRFGYLPIAQRSPKCKGQEESQNHSDKKYGLASARLKHELPITILSYGVDIGD